MTRFEHAHFLLELGNAPPCYTKGLARWGHTIHLLSHAVLQPFMEAGLDSLGGIEFRASLMDVFAIDLPATVVFDHPTITSIARHILAMDKVGVLPHNQCDYAFSELFPETCLNSTMHKMPNVLVMHTHHWHLEEEYV